MALDLGIVLLADTMTAEATKCLARRVPDNEFAKMPWRPHLSLLHLTVQDNLLGEVIRAFDDVELPRHFLDSSCHELAQLSSGWHFWEMYKTTEMLALQVRMLPLASLRSQNSEFKWRDQASAAQVRAWEEWGYPNVGEAWKTHFTYGYTTTREQTRRWPYAHSGLLKLAALAHMGEYGTVSQIIRTRPL